VDPVPYPLLVRKSGSARNRTSDLWIFSQELLTTRPQMRSTFFCLMFKSAASSRKLWGGSQTLEVSYDVWKAGLRGFGLGCHLVFLWCNVSEAGSVAILRHVGGRHLLCWVRKNKLNTNHWTTHDSKLKLQSQGSVSVPQVRVIKCRWMRWPVYVGRSWEMHTESYQRLCYTYFIHYQTQGVCCFILCNFLCME
jgi:hypothetical protein